MTAANTLSCVPQKQLMTEPVRYAWCHAFPQAQAAVVAVLCYLARFPTQCLHAAIARPTVFMTQSCLSAGINSFFAALSGTLPNTTFAQNNGVLALTRCASRNAGFACGFWLILCGVIAKVSCIVIEPTCCLNYLIIKIINNDASRQYCFPYLPLFWRQLL